ncbi:MAG: sulfatase-like hydrolase/transferase [Planctomycetota bacterium]
MVQPKTEGSANLHPESRTMIHERDRRISPPRRFRLGPAVWFTLTMTAGIALAFEWEHYRKLLQWQKSGVTLLEQGIFFWIVWSKSLFAAFLPLFICQAASSLGWDRFARFTMAASSNLIAFWILLDLRVRDATGNHATDYLQFLASRATWQFGGQQANYAVPILGLLFATTATTTILWLAFDRWMNHHPVQENSRVAPTACLVATAVFLALMAGIVPAKEVVGNGIFVERLTASLPLSGLLFTSPAAGDNDLARFRAEFRRESSRIKPCLQSILQSAQPVDGNAVVDRPSPPNVILLVLESLRHTALDAEVMPKLHRWSGNGIRCNNHYSTSNCSHFGVFALLYGRLPFVYDATLDARVPPQFCATMRRSGYECHWISSADESDWMRMGEYLNERYWDRVSRDNEGDWPSRDLRTAARIKELASRHSGKPQFIVGFFMSTHFGYEYPPDREHFKPASPPLSLLEVNRRRDHEGILNRYKNAARFLDDEVSSLIESLDPSRNIIIVTGDHGESIFEDGVVSHWFQLSDIETKVPFVMVGPGVRPAVIDQATTHVDVLPTVLGMLNGRRTRIAHNHGVDIIRDSLTDRDVLLYHHSLNKLNDQWVLVRRDRRLKMRLFRSEGNVEAEWFCMPDMTPDLSSNQGPRAAVDWVESLGKKLRTLSNTDVLAEEIVDRSNTRR